MSKVGIVRSTRLLHKEGQERRGYNLSHHAKAVKYVEDSLRAFGIPYLLLEESALDESHLLAHSIVVIIAVGLRVCSEETFQRLIDLAEQGWLVFSGVSSFYYRESSTGDPRRVMQARIREIFELSNTSYIKSRKFDSAVFEFNPTRFQWLTNRMASRAECRNRWMLALLHGTPVPITHGDIVATRLQSATGVLDPNLEDKTLPAFLIREYPSGGVLIYACFTPRLLENSKQIYRNLWEFRSEPKRGVNQIRVLKILVLVLTAVLGLLVAFLVGDQSVLVYIVATLSGLIIGVLGNKLTDLVDRFLEDS